jgi:hypothetical protein
LKYFAANVTDDPTVRRRGCARTRGARWPGGPGQPGRGRHLGLRRDRRRGGRVDLASGVGGRCALLLHRPPLPAGAFRAPLGRRSGAALAGLPRDEFVVSTKVGRLLIPNPSPKGLDLPMASWCQTTSTGHGTTHAMTWCAAFAADCKAERCRRGDARCALGLTRPFGEPLLAECLQRQAYRW